jgi:hypothetical protein
MRRLVTVTLISVLLLMLPVATFAGDRSLPDPLPSPLLACPTFERIDGVPIIPEGTPDDCLSLQPIKRMEGDPCALDADGVAPEMCQGQAATGDEFSGASYTLTEITLPDGTRIPVADGWLLVTPGVLSGSAGCNTFAGALSSLLRHDHDALTIVLADGVVGTEMACEGRMHAEAAFTAILTSGPLELSNTDTATHLTSGAGQMLLRQVDGELITDGQEVSLIAALLLVFPLLVAAVGIAVALSKPTGGQ